RNVKANEKARQRRLPAPGLSDDGNTCSRTNLEGHAIHHERCGRTVLKAHPIQGNVAAGARRAPGDAPVLLDRRLEHIIDALEVASEELNLGRGLDETPERAQESSRERIHPEHGS